MKLSDTALLKAQSYINGAWVGADATFDVRNPATGEVLASLPDMGADETRDAITAAETAFKSWRKMLAKERSAILQKWFRLIMDAQEDLAQILTAEMGKPLAEARGEIAYGASFIEWFAEEGKRVYGDVIPSPQPDRRIMVIKQPIGVVGAITPWNFPNAMITRKVAPALAVGCTMVGGNAPFIVFDDADIDAAVDGAMASKYRNSGQTCVCANRLYVQDGVYDTFVDKLAAKVAEMKVGNGANDGVVQGPLINDEALEKVEEHIADALSKGGELVLGGKRHALGGSFFEPTLIRNVTKDMKVAREETFGPVAPVFRFSDEADVIAQANDTEFGLASYFYARDLARVWRVAEELECGMVGINTGILSTEVAPFGGVKQSGLGREGSKYGIEDYIEMKYLCMAGM